MSGLRSTPPGSLPEWSERAADGLLTRLQETGWAPVGGFSLTAINQLVEQLGLTPSEVIITRHGEVEVIHRV